MTDVFVMPSVSEPFGIVPLEAMQSDVPVIISNQSGVSEILKHAIKIDFWDTLCYGRCNLWHYLITLHLSDHFKRKEKMK